MLSTPSFALDFIRQAARERPVWFPNLQVRRLRFENADHVHERIRAIGSYIIDVLLAVTVAAFPLVVAFLVSSPLAERLGWNTGLAPAFTIGVETLHVAFVVKRQKQAIGLNAIHEFRGALMGTYGQGLFLTTGRFTHTAVDEANKHGGPPIILLDADAIVEVALEHNLTWPAPEAAEATPGR